MSLALSRGLEAAIHLFGRVTAMEMYKVYILEVSGQSCPSPPTVFTLYLVRERLRLTLA